uniref:FACT complex subunit SSRP1 n=1 Tax=Ditylenchus dipsaci TaxID=166011 RepID=A0A915DME8_9BILA
MSGGSSVSTVSSVASAKGGSSGAQSRVLVRLKVVTPQKFCRNLQRKVTPTDGQSLLERRTSPIHRQKPAEKVTFMLHQSFDQPKRAIKEPPFQVTETGYGGFTMPIMLQFSGVSKVYTINYDLSLSMDKYGEFAIEHKIELKSPSKEISELVQKYCSYKKDVVEKVIQKPIAIPEKRPPKSESKLKEPNASSSSSSSTAVIVSGQKSSKPSGEKKHESSKSKIEDRKLSTSSTAPKFEDTKDSRREGETTQGKEEEKDKDRDRSKERHKDKDKKKTKEHSHSSGQPDQKHEPKPPQTPPPVVAAAPEDTNKLKRKERRKMRYLLDPPADIPLKKLLKSSKLSLILQAVHQTTKATTFFHGQRHFLGATFQCFSIRFFPSHPLWIWAAERAG